MKIYSTVDIPELSESLQKLVKSYYNRINHKKQFVSKYDTENGSIVKCGLLLNQTTKKIEPNIYGVIKGQKVEDSVLIEFYIQHADIMGVGDKLAYFTALKREKHCSRYYEKNKQRIRENQFRKSPELFSL